MIMVGILVLLGVCCISGVQSAATSLLCPTCDPVKNPDECTLVHKCTHNQYCSVDIRDVVEPDGTHRYYLYGCKAITECPQAVASALIGKRGRAANHADHGVKPGKTDHHTLENILKHGTLVCSDCCTENNGHCNKDLCAPPVANNTLVTAQPPSTTTGLVSNTTIAVTPAVTSAAATTNVTTTPVVSPTTPAVLVAQSTTDAPTTTIATTQVTSTTPGGDPNCRDHEEDGLSCATFDLFRFCTDTSVFAYVIAHEKCPKHCGFCTPSTQTTSAPVVPPPKGACEDYEQDGFQCSKFDLFSFCTDSSSLAYVIAHEKCRKHCGFCTAGRK